ncbi:MAG: pyridoxal-phosphate dependent enzyme [Gemmatimonadaceae bacterium]|nr:pyridoxal-phosphate dependent enzyme [Gemmatimonadaceae bacterium]
MRSTADTPSRGATPGRAAIESDASFPLARRFPALRSLPRARLGAFPSPVVRIAGVGARGGLWVKRDDLNAPSLGGNKVRALELLLGEVQPGDEVLTIGGEGSTHVLATAVFGRALGARVTAIRWRHEMNPAAHAVAARAAAVCDRVYTTASAPAALALALLTRVRHAPRWVPAGGSSALGVLGHANAALELADQIARGELPQPSRVVVPLGSGGTAAGLALGFAIAGLDIVVVGARVAPRLVANRGHVLALARAGRRLIAALERAAHGTRARPVIPRVDPRRVQVAHDAYGGAYGRPAPAAREAAARIERAAGLRLDDTYSAKALAVALALDLAGEGDTLFWLTFDPRTLDGTGLSYG